MSRLCTNYGRYEVEGCINGTPVTKITIFNVEMPDVTTILYSDDSDGTNWVQGECIRKDMEVICVAENSNIYIIERQEDGTILIKDFSGNDVTGTVTPKKCDNVNYDIEKENFCIDGINYTRSDVIDVETGTVTSLFWQDITGTIVTDPTVGATIVIKGICSIEGTTISNEVISGIGDTATSGLALIPETAVSALIQVRGNSIKFSTTGTPVTGLTGVGFLSFIDEEIKLTSRDAIDNFLAIAVNNLTTAELYVEYYDYIL